MVPVLPPPLLPLLPPLPQPMTAMEAKKATNASITIQLRLRRAGMPKRQTSARAAPPAEGQSSLVGLATGRLRDEVGAVVETVKTSVPEPVTVADAREHVAGSLAAVGLMEQLKLTAPVKPPEGVTVIVEVLPVLAPEETVMLPLLVRVKLGLVVTLTVSVVVSVREPEVPVTVTE